MTAPYDTVFLFDVDNTLLDNDSVIADLRAHIEHEFGAATARRYWHHFEALSGEATRLLRMSDFRIDYPFAERLYPNAVDAVRRLGEFGPTVILTDGDVAFQPRMVRRSGLWDAVAGRVGRAGWLTVVRFSPILAPDTRSFCPSAYRQRGNCAGVRYAGRGREQPRRSPRQARVLFV